MTPAEALARVRAAGVEVALDGGELRLRAPPGTLTDERLAWVRTHKPALLAALAAEAGPEPPAVPPPLTEAETENIAEALEERAATQEHDGGLPRAEAERQARGSMRVYRYRLADAPPWAPGTEWLVLLAPGCDLTEARRALELRHGAERVLAVRAHDLHPGGTA